MNLHEYHAKQIFSKNGIAIPDGAMANDAGSVERVARELNAPVVLKPQMRFKKRGKLGIIRFVDSAEGARREADVLFGTEVKGEKIRIILVEKQVSIDQEYYLAVTVDYSKACPVIILSRRGGVDIEELSEKSPEDILRLHVNIVDGLSKDHREKIRDFLGDDMLDIAEKLYGIFRDCDAELVEINPLVRTTEDDLIAVDGVLNVNGDSVFRHPELTSYVRDIEAADPVSLKAAENSWTYIDLPGDIAILSSGAGLTMTILDLIHFAGGRAANFLDTAQIDENGIYQAFELLCSAKPAGAILVNIFAGLNRCDSLAAGIRRYIEDHRVETPLVIRMVGNGEDAGHRILERAGIRVYQDLEAAVEQVVKLAGNS
ncbi:MAG: succinate--CoA ligase subunit beta [candidate division KSB1 bacterium]|jgi:succinyl-CoA synthetase beta subunit|nr:succinate--CoA ligase subunit beta [candidate division KSB1 bacterium]